MLAFGAMDALIDLSPLREPERAELTKVAAQLRGSDSVLHECVLRALIPHVRRWTLGSIGWHSELEDAVQESLCEIARALYRFEGRASLRTLARRITVRTALRHAGRVRKLGHVELDVEPPDDGGDPERRLIERWTAERIHALLEGIAPARRIAFLLCVVEGLTPQEAAAEVGCSALAMRGRLFQARRELKARLLGDARLREILETNHGQ